MHRRLFLAGTGAALAGLALEGPTVLAKEPKPKLPKINDTLESIAALLKGKGLVESVEFHGAKKPKKGVVQWRWTHYRPAIALEWLPYVERTNRELFAAMDAVRTMPDSGLDSIMHEGLIENRESQMIDHYREEQRIIVRTALTVPNPFGFQDITPSERAVDEGLKVFKNLDRPVNQFVCYEGQWYQERISALSRFGAGYIQSQVHGVALRPAEDATLDANAAKAEKSGDAAEFQRCVHAERDKHFIALVAAAKERIVHLLVGYAHVLTDDIGEHNSVSKDDISHLVVTVPGVVASEAYEKSLRERK